MADNCDSHPESRSKWPSSADDYDLEEVIGSLLDVIRFTMHKQNCRNGVLDEVAIATVLKEVLKGLEYFHTNGHIHRMAPEVMEQQPSGYDTKADIWSFGILAIELSTGTAPYHKFPPMKVLIMTLQNDPPTLDSCAEDRDQYKQYSKTFRHDFFKKAKDRSYIAKYLALRIQDRKKMEEKIVSRRKPTSIRNIRMSDSGEWKFGSGSDDDTDNNDNTTSAKYNEMLKLQQLENQTVKGMENIGGMGDETQTIIQNSMENKKINSDDKSDELFVQNETSAEITNSGVNDSDNKVFKLTLRIRNQQGDLHDIKFEFNKTSESVEEVVQEMVSASLIDERDSQNVACNMTHLIENCALGSATFALKSCTDSNQTPDDKLLYGFAQLSLNR
ncbi:unnamed protein product [Didymodactylos carnosus]|uniref:non-specific serine/threonine protein kinase n=1 Tax=Didymodactylos carnosus TaxID=1234261 RepID=A0A814JYE4_9BILA|nr:unnamed protein product [Didymodactylos carnosus]CAF3812245.1 unnamed protein product [Didymodactylos carnosus]